MLRKYEHRIVWNMNMQCNFSCPYCYFIDNLNSAQNDQAVFTPEKISESFNKTEKEWLILLSGGEPLIYPGFLKTAELLTKKHFIQLSTNLLSDNIFHFAENIPAERVMAVSASLHITEREKQKGGIDDFIKKCLKLQEKGFRIIVSYVTWPPLFERMEKDISFLQNAGIKQITALTYRGVFEKKHYPGSYQTFQLDLIKKYAIDDAEMLIATNKTGYRGFYCEAGYKYFSMDSDGNVFRCGTVKKKYGNLFNGTFSPGNSDKVCPAKLCIDCYLGIISVKEKKKKFIF
jgi:MoaA/NifB/PqqE/SkfB family radical SAM enzyme